MVAGWSTKHLNQFRQRYVLQLQHKLDIANRHEPGTAWHNRAMVEATMYQRRIEEIDRELARRE